VRQLAQPPQLVHDGFFLVSPNGLWSLRGGHLQSDREHCHGWSDHTHTLQLLPTPRLMYRRGAPGITAVDASITLSACAPELLESALGSWMERRSKRAPGT
jgi:hypothetical protein